MCIFRTFRLQQVTCSAHTFRTVGPQAEVRLDHLTVQFGASSVPHTTRMSVHHSRTVGPSVAVRLKTPTTAGFCCFSVQNSHVVKRPEHEADHTAPEHSNTNDTPAMSRVPRSYKLNNRRLIPDKITNLRVRLNEYALPNTAGNKTHRTWCRG